MDQPDQGASGRDPDDGSGEDPEVGGLRGWISPDDRLWRHPSESAASTARPPGALTAPERTAHHVRTGPWIVGGATACFAIALVATVLVTTTTGSDPGATPGTPDRVTLVGTPTTDPGVARPARPAAINAMVAAIRPSTVGIRVARSGRTISTTGLVAESGGIIVTALPALVGARSITVVESDGTRQTAELVGADQASGLAVIRIDDDLPAAVFDDGDPSVGGIAVAAALDPASTARRRPVSQVYAGTVVSSGQSLDADAPTTTFSATAVRAPLAHDDLGCPLLDPSGHVTGMLEMTRGSGRSTMAVFLPSQLVLGVALQLVQSGLVEHGWMGVRTTDAAPATPPSGGATVASSSVTEGARVDSVAADGPAADAGVVPGDVITAVDGFEVHSSAELRTWLYPDPPGTDLAVTLERRGNQVTTSIILAQPATDAPGDGSSP